MLAVSHLGPQLFLDSPAGWYRNCNARRNVRFVVSQSMGIHQQIAQAAEEAFSGGPIELPSEFDEQPTSPLQIAGTVVLLGTITVLLARSLRRRIKDAREKKPLKEQAKKAVAAIAMQEVEKPPPKVQDTLVGAVLAGGIAFVLYQCTTAVDSSFASKPLPTDYAARNIAVTIRTIVSGLFYLATCVYGANAVGLTLYGIQLVIDPPQNKEQQQTSGSNEKNDDNVAHEKSDLER